MIPAYRLYETMPPSGPSFHQHVTWNFMFSKVMGGSPLILDRFGQQEMLSNSVSLFHCVSVDLLKA